MNDENGTLMNVILRTVFAGQFHFTPVTALEVQKSLEALNSKKATGLDDIQARLLKIAAPAISESLCFLLNFSLISGKVPSDWKKAKISAIFKKVQN